MTCNGAAAARQTKKPRKIPVHVVEDHNEALKYIYSEIGAKKLPVNENTIVHFDSHPDLMLPRRLKGEIARSGKELLEHIQIENWILPAVAAGHIGEVIWVKPQWSHQLSEGTRNFRVGEDSRNGLLRVDAREPYFLSDALYQHDLVNSQEITLTVARLDKLDTSTIKVPFILDIDLDYITVNDPFEDLYEKANLTKRLELIYSFQDPTSDNQDEWRYVNGKREEQLDYLESLFEHLEDEGNLDNWSGNKSELFDEVFQLQEAVKAAYPDEKIDWLLIHDAGCTRDHGGLPKHLSTEEEEVGIIDRMAAFFRMLPPPALITVARSTEDDYCPSNAVERVQNSVIASLKQNFDINEPILHYLSEDS